MVNVSAKIIARFHFSATGGPIPTFIDQEVRDLLRRSLVLFLGRLATVLVDSFQTGILKENENVRLYHQKSTVKPFEDLADSVQIIMKWTL